MALQTIETLNAAVEVKDVARAFGRLTAVQQLWLLARRFYDADLACSTDQNLSATVHVSWKRTSAFKLCYDWLADPQDRQLDEQIIESLSLSNGLKAMIEERLLLEHPWGESGRLDTVKGQAMKNAIERVKPKQTETLHIIKISDAARQVVDSEVRVVE